MQARAKSEPLAREAREAIVRVRAEASRWRVKVEGVPRGGGIRYRGRFHGGCCGLSVCAQQDDEKSLTIENANASCRPFSF